jgi:glycosyltransferase involved in cell wall biosynthesis
VKIAVFHDLPSGGGKRALYELSLRLARAHAVDVFTLSTADPVFGDLRAIARRHSVYDFAPLAPFDRPFGRLNQWQRWRDLHRLTALAQRIARDVDAQRYDVLFAHPCMWTQAPLLLSHLRTPALYYCAEPPRVLYDPFLRTRAVGVRGALDRVDPLIPLYRSALRTHDRQATRRAKRVLVNSRFTQAQVAGIYGIAPHVCYLGVDTHAFRPDLSVVRQPYVLSVGALQSTKGFDFLIKSLGHLPAESRPALRIVANSELRRERQSLERLAADLGVTVAIEVGVGQETLVQRYREATLFVYAPVNEPFGLVTLEAMACATPVVAVGEGGVRETVLDGETGVLAERDPEQFAQAVRALLADPRRRAQLGQQGRVRVEQHWSWDASTVQVEEHLRAVAADTRAAGTPGVLAHLRVVDRATNR